VLFYGSDPAQASLLDNGMPAIAFIITGLPITGRPTGHRRATQRLFSSRMMLTRSAWFPPRT
jgi:hypothetical protein